MMAAGKLTKIDMNAKELEKEIIENIYDSIPEEQLTDSMKYNIKRRVSFMWEGINKYADRRVIEELNHFGYLTQGADEDIMYGYIERRIKELKQDD